MKGVKRIFMGAVLMSLMGLAQESYGLLFDPNVPATYPEIVITKTDQAAPGVLIGTVGQNFFNTYNVVLDRSGYPLIYRQGFGQSLSRFVQPNGLIGVYGFFTGSYDFKDETLTVVDSYKVTPDVTGDFHDVKLLPNGHILLIGKEYRYIDMSQTVPGGRPDARVAGDVVQEFDVDKNLVFEWHSFDHIPITDTFHDLTQKSIDYAHINSVTMDPLDNNILVSLRTTSEIVKIGRNTGQVIWRLSGKGNDFTFIGEHEENAPYYTVGQHDVHRLLNGNLLYFDNGNIRGGGINPSDREYSRAVEYHLDEEAMTATMVWEFRHTPDISAGCTGAVKRFDNGNTYIDWGCAVSQSGYICTEVSSEGDIVYEMKFPTPGPSASLTKQEWNSPDLVTAQTFSNVAAGQTYNSATADVSVTVNSLTGSSSSNGLTIKRCKEACRFPHFSGRAPIVLVKRVTIAGYGLTDVDFDVSLSTDDLEIIEPNQLTVYHRPYVGQGEFTALATTFDYGDNTLNVTNTTLGEFIFGYPDLAEIANAPNLYAPEDMGSVNQDQPVLLDWSPNGFVQSYGLQVATDAAFTNLVVDISGLAESSYELASVDPNSTYYWRVNTTNLGGTSAWATRSFYTVPPMVHVTRPNGGEYFVFYDDEYILWEDNLAEDVVIELYKDGVYVMDIATAPSIGAYEWEVDGTLDPGSDYTVKVRSSLDDTIADTSDATFDIGVSPADLNFDGAVNALDLSMLTDDWLEMNSDLITDLNGDGEVNQLDYAIFAKDFLK